jgi:SAM-dependent methyltransferase
MSSANGWSNAGALDAAEVAEMAAHLEDRASRADQQQVNLALCQALAPQPGERLLEVGCGSAALCRLLAPRLLPGGSITGLDSALSFLRLARQYSVQAGQASGVNWLTGLAETLPCQSASFDAAFAARLLLHVADPIAVVCEMARVVRPGGRVTLMDWDVGTLIVDHPDRALTRRILEWRCDHYGGDNWSGRQLWGWARQAGLKGVAVQTVTSLACSAAPGYSAALALTLTLRRAAQAACQAGVIRAAEHDAWASALEQRLAKGYFFASITYFIVTGWR